MNATSVDDSSERDDAFSGTRVMGVVNDNFERVFLGRMSRACHSTQSAGSHAGRASSWRCACSRNCSAGCSCTSSAPLIRPMSCSSSASMPGLSIRNAFAAYLKPLRNTKWVVYCKRPFGGPKEVLRYLARYTHRVAISNRRLLSLDDKGVTFKWKDYRLPKKVATLSGDDARHPRVHPPLSHARAARRLPSHPTKIIEIIDVIGEVQHQPPD